MPLMRVPSARQTLADKGYRLDEMYDITKANSQVLRSLKLIMKCLEIRFYLLEN